MPRATEVAPAEERDAHKRARLWVPNRKRSLPTSYYYARAGLGLCVEGLGARVVAAVLGRAGWAVTAHVNGFVRHAQCGTLIRCKR